MEENEWRQQLQRTQCKIFHAATLEGLEEVINQWLFDHPMFALVEPPINLSGEHLWGMVLFYEEIEDILKPRNPYLTPDLEGRNDAV